MTHAGMAPAMGLLMGGMIPLMAHGPAGGIGLAFVLGHVAVAGLALVLVLVLPRARVWLGRHRPTGAMGLRMSGGVAVGFAAICAHCLLTWHGSV